MKLKVDQYKVYNKGRVHKVIVFPRMEAAWAYDDNPEDDQLMLDGSMEFYQQIHHALAALIADPSLIIYFPIKHKEETRFGGQMTYDAVLLRPELQFRRSEWRDIKSKLDKKHWVGKYTIRHNEKKLNDLWEKEEARKPWFYSRTNVKEELLGDTIFLVLPRVACLDYHSHITFAMNVYDSRDEYAMYAGIGYISPKKMVDEYQNKQNAEVPD